MKIEKRLIADLKPAEYNPRQSTKEQEIQLKRSLKKFGCVEPIIVNEYEGRENIIVGGHFRCRELKKLGQKEVECVIVNLNLEEEKELNIRLNANTGEWDFDKLANNFEIEELKDWGLQSTFFDNLDDNNNLQSIEDIDEKEDEYNIDVENTRNIKVGDIWQLGKHRLICGDSTNVVDIEKLMNGKKADMVFTDPPYNINISVHKKSDNKDLKILNDNLEQGEFLNFLDVVFKNMKIHSKEKIHNYICCNMKCYSNFEKVVNNNWTKKVSDIFIWKKDLPGLGFGYREQYEIIIFTGDMDSVVFQDKCESNVWEYAKSSSMAFRSQEKDNIDKSTSLLHPTIKPSFLIMRALKNSSKSGNIILDLFGGSGSTLIACERCGRIAYLSELDPIFCNVIINRWENLTGSKAYKIEG